MARTRLGPVRQALLLAIAALGVPAVAAAERVSLALDTGVTGQSNVFRSEDDEEADGTVEVRPRLRLQRNADELRYLVEYSPTYDYYFETRGINGFDQFGRAELVYAPTPTGTASLHTELAYFRSVRADRVEGPAGVSEVVPTVSGRVFRALLDAGYEHSFSSTTLGRLDLDFQSYEYTTPGNADSLGVGATLGLEHELRQTLALGGLASVHHRRFDELAPQPSSTNLVLYGAPTLRWRPTPTLTVEAAAGPGWVSIDSDAPEGVRVSRFRTMGTGAGEMVAYFNGCGMAAGEFLLSRCPFDPIDPSFPPSDERVPVDFPGGGQERDENTLTAFADLLVTSEQEWGSVELQYRRVEDASSGSGATSIRDVVTGALTFGVPESSWGLRLRANWNRRETVEELDRVEVTAAPSGQPPGPFGPDYAEAAGLVVIDSERRRVDQYWADVSVRRRLTASLSVELTGRYLYQDLHGSRGPTDHFQNWSGELLLRYAPSWLSYDW